MLSCLGLVPAIKHPEAPGQRILAALTDTQSSVCSHTSIADSTLPPESQMTGHSQMTDYSATSMTGEKDSDTMFDEMLSGTETPPGETVPADMHALDVAGMDNTEWFGWVDMKKLHSAGFSTEDVIGKFMRLGYQPQFKMENKQTLIKMAKEVWVKFKHGELHDGASIQNPHDLGDAASSHQAHISPDETAEPDKCDKSEPTSKCMTGHVSDDTTADKTDNYDKIFKSDDKYDKPDKKFRWTRPKLIDMGGQPRVQVEPDQLTLNLLDRFRAEDTEARDHHKQTQEHIAQDAVMAGMVADEGVTSPMKTTTSMQVSPASSGPVHSPPTTRQKTTDDRPPVPEFYDYGVDENGVLKRPKYDTQPCLGTLQTCVHYPLPPTPKYNSNIHK